MIRYDDANWFYQAMRRMADPAPMAWFYSHTLHHIDRFIFRLTRGRHTFANLIAGLPVVMLTTLGAKSGERHTQPVAGLPDGERMAVIGSNFGQRHHPGWYHNLRANPRASINVGGVTKDVVAYEAKGAERERLWQLGLEVHPAWAHYERRVSRYRHIPIMVLTPVKE